MQNYSSAPTQDIRQLLDTSQEIFVLLGRNPTFDTVAAALSLYLSLSSVGKRVSIACPSPMTVEFNRLVGIDKITQGLSNGGRNLVVSFPYVEGSIEKVSYNIENDTFNLVIEPREGYPTITQDKLSYTFGGGTFDCIFTIGVATLEMLDSLYFQNQNLFSQKPVVNIDINPANARFGKVNTIEQNYSSLSELLSNLLNALNLRMDADIATNLLAGITLATNNFMSPTSGVAAFETAAILMRSGARRMDMGISAMQPQQPTQPYQFPTNPNSNILNTMPINQPYPQSYQPSQTQMRQQQAAPYLPQQGTRPPMQQQTRVAQPKPVQPMPQQENKQQLKKQDAAPPDWLKPKIYKGSTLL